MDKHKVDWEKIEELLKKCGRTKSELSRMMGMNASWVTNSQTRDIKANDKQLEQMALILGCEKDYLLASKGGYDELAPSQFEVDVINLLTEIRDGVNKLLESRNLKPSEPPKEPEKDPLEVAEKVLKNLLQNRQGVKYDEYIEAVHSAGVDNDKIADAVIAKAGYEKQTRGYGNNKKTWILKTI